MFAISKKTFLTKQWRAILGLVLVFSFLSFVLITVPMVDHLLGGSDHACAAAAAPGLDCPQTSSSASSLLSHITALQHILDLVVPIQLLGIVLLLLVSLWLWTGSPGLLAGQQERIRYLLRRSLLLPVSLIKEWLVLLEKRDPSFRFKRWRLLTVSLVV